MDKLDAYLARIGAARGEPDLATLRAVQRAHRLAVPFENLNIPLGRGISLDPDDLHRKMVEDRRGGYCFEQNGLLLPMLRMMGFDARPLLSRVWMRVSDPDEVPPRTHTLLLVTIGEDEFIADAGFGGGYTPPLKLTEGAEDVAEDGARHRLRRDALHGWMLERNAGAGWHRQYSFTTEPVWPDDLEAANHWTSTRPDTRFTRLRIVARALPDGYVSMIDRTLTLVRGGESSSREIEDAAEYRRVLAETFDIRLDSQEVETLGLF